MTYAIAHLLHVLAAILWIAPAFVLFMASGVLPRSADGESASTWAALIGRLAPWSLGAITVSWLSGIWLMFFYYKGFGDAGAHVDTMFLLALILTALFGAEAFLTRRHFNAAVSSGDGVVASAKLRAILRHAKIVLVLGLFTAAIASYGPLLN